MNDDEPEQLHLILPGGMFAEIQTRAGKREINPAQLIDEVLDHAERKSPVYWQEMKATARVIDDALALNIPEPWPESFEDRLVVGVLLRMWQKQSSETLLLETSRPKMDAIEEICREKGISYEEFTQETLDHFFGRRNGEATEDELFRRTAYQALRRPLGAFSKLGHTILSKRLTISPKRS